MMEGNCHPGQRDRALIGKIVSIVLKLEITKSIFPHQ